MKADGNLPIVKLGDFILENMERILTSWESYARKFWVGQLPDTAALRNHAETMLRAVAADMASPQTEAERDLKSEGGEVEPDSEMGRAAAGHAIARVNDGFDIERLVAEFRALRASVVRIWVESVPAPSKDQISELGRFNEALDQLVAQSVRAFNLRVEKSRRLFLGILGHDLRQPLHSIRMFTEILAKKPEELAPGVETVLTSMTKCCDSMAGMLGDLLDFTSSQLGSAMPVTLAASNLELVCREVLNEVQAAAPDRQFHFEAEGNLEGEWDAPRLKQMASNLLSNAMQHGAAGEPIDTRLHGTDEEVSLSVHNKGTPIPKEAVGSLFDPMVRISNERKGRPAGSIGLGLYICQQIAAAHAGAITIESSAETGTTFTVRLPRRPAFADPARNQ